MARQRNTDKPRPTQYEVSVVANQWKKWKREAASPEYAHEGFAVINSVGKVSRETYLTAMLDMEEKYPGRGWKEQENELEASFLKAAERPKTPFAAYLKEIPRGFGMLQMDSFRTPA